MDEPRKRCVTCHLEQPLSAYNRRAAAPDGLQPRCRSCSRDWYLTHREAHRANVRARTARVRAENLVHYEQFLREHPCVDCSERDLRVLELDHEDPGQKLVEVGRIVGTGMSWRRVLEEIAKCSVRCANCHRRRTAEQLGYWRLGAEQRRQEDAVRRAQERLDALFPER